MRSEVVVVALGIGALCVVAADAACPGCDQSPTLDLACASDVDCEKPARCIDAVCATVAAAGEGESAGAEGEGAEGEGAEGEGAEGEGAEGEGEGEGAEGEGEGEGEGAAGEGEGEGAPPTSCADVLAANPSAPSGAYTIVVNGANVDVQCDMDPNHDGGGFTLLFLFDVGDAIPNGFIAGPDGGFARPTGVVPGGATLVTPPIASWQSMRGVVHAFAFGNTEAFNEPGLDVESQYLDGLSITVGAPGARQHVFSFASGLADNYGGTGSASACPCDGTLLAPAFVGSSYRCEEATNCVDGTGASIYDTTDVLFDGNQITPATCVGAAESAPEFSTTLPAPISNEDVELRLMFSAANDEDVEIIHADIWVR